MNRKILLTLEFEKIREMLANYAATSLGKSLAGELEPNAAIAEVKIRLQATDEAVHALRLKGSVPFGGIRDVFAPLRRAEIGGTLNPAELLDIANTMNGARRLQRFIAQLNNAYSVPLLANLSNQLTEHKSVEEAIRSSIDDNAAVVDSASTELSKVRHELRSNESRARDKLEQMIRTPSIQKMLQENLLTMRNDRYVIPVKMEYRASFGGIVHDQSASGATLFIEPETVVAMNNKLRELKIKEEAEVYKVLSALSSKVAAEAEPMKSNLHVLAEMDFICAKAGLAQAQKSTLPLMNDRGFIKLRKGRHPLIAAETVVPLNLEIGNRYTTIIVTGPNTGGKTVALKTVGLLSLMAMSGLFVPAEDGSQLCVFDAIYADIGDEQSIEQSLSTFSSHMSNIIRILREMTPKSLVLLDEIGAGTDPTEGSALAIAILEHIHRKGSRVMATTHYSELKAYAYDRSGIINASMEFDVQSLSPTYRLLVGVPGRSNAFAIAERLGLAQTIIDDARGQVKEEDTRVEAMIAMLEENRKEAEAQRHAAEQLRGECEQMREQLEQEQRRFGEQRMRLLAQAEREAAQAVAKAQQEAERVIAELRRMALEEHSSIKEHKLIEARRALDLAVPQLTDKHRSDLHAKKPTKHHPGDEVFIANMGQKGSIIEIINSTEAIVQFGVMKMKVALADLEAVGKSTVKKPQLVNVTGVKRTRDEQVRTELDLRGQSLEDSLIEVDRFLDETYLANLTQVYIIHGKGTGVLRNGVQDYMRRHKHVKSYRLGNFGEGGTGVTVVELK